MNVCLLYIWLLKLCCLFQKTDITSTGQVISTKDNLLTHRLNSQVHEKSRMCVEHYLPGADVGVGVEDCDVVVDGSEIKNKKQLLDDLHGD